MAYTHTAARHGTAWRSCWLCLACLLASSKLLVVGSGKPSKKGKQGITPRLVTIQPNQATTTTATATANFVTTIIRYEEFNSSMLSSLSL